MERGKTKRTMAQLGALELPNDLLCPFLGRREASERNKAAGEKKAVDRDLGGEFSVGVRSCGRDGACLFGGTHATWPWTRES